MTHLGLGL